MHGFTNHSNYLQKKTLTQKNLELSTSLRVGTIAHQYKVLKQAGVVHDIKCKTIRSVISLLCISIMVS